ncbi:Glutathione S-transferase 1-1, partial [Fragariocoptes setiger]
MDFYYMPESPPCRAVELVADLVGAELNKKYVNLFKGEQLNEDFVKINPQHCVPTLVDGDLILWESRAIMAYLVHKYKKGDPLYPEEPKLRARVDHMLYFDLGTLFKTQSEYLRPRLEGKRILDANNEKKFLEALRLLTLALEKHQFAAGDTLTLADISIVCSLTLSEGCHYDLSSFKTIVEYQERVKKALPSYDRVNKEPMARFKAFVEHRQKCSP